MKKIVPVIALLLIVCSCNKSGVNTTTQSVNKTWIIGDWKPYMMVDSYPDTINGIIVVKKDTITNIIPPEYNFTSSSQFTFCNGLCFTGYNYHITGDTLFYFSSDTSIIVNLTTNRLEFYSRNQTTLEDTTSRMWYYYSKQ
jgi:hypothetical protein